MALRCGTLGGTIAKHAGGIQCDNLQGPQLALAGHSERSNQGSYSSTPFALESLHSERLCQRGLQIRAATAQQRMRVRNQGAQMHAAMMRYFTQVLS